MATQDQTYIGQTNIQTPESHRYSASMFPVRPPVLTQQITADFQLLQEAWNKLSSQMSEMTETNKLLKRAIKNTYKKLTSIPKTSPKKASNTAKTPKKADKAVKCANKSNKDSKDSNKTSKNKTVKANNKKNTTSNTVSEIQTSDSNQNIDMDKK